MDGSDEPAVRQDNIELVFIKLAIDGSVRVDETIGLLGHMMLHGVSQELRRHASGDTPAAPPWGVKGGVTQKHGNDLSEQRGGFFNGASSRSELNAVRPAANHFFEARYIE